MKVGREFAGFALPFAAGTVSGVLAGRFFPLSYPAFGAVSITVVATSLLLLISPYRKKPDTTAVLSAIITAALSAGMLCGITSWAISLSAVPKPLFSGLGEAMECAVDTIPFRKNETNAIIKALITGERSDIPTETVQAFRASGASHILALSGLHLGIIYGIASKILKILGNSRPTVMIRSICTIILCGTYTLATGAGDSITRAFLFILLGETAKITRRCHDTGTLLWASLVLQLCINPQACMAVSFQLSYAAMAGIAFIFPWLKGFWPGDETDGTVGPLHRIWNAASLSIACQMTTGPLAFLYFGTFPKHFILTNLIAMPLTGLIIPFSLATLCLDTWGICPEILLRATEALVTALSEALDIIARM